MAATAALVAGSLLVVPLASAAPATVALTPVSDLADPGLGVDATVCVGIYANGYCVGGYFDGKKWCYGLNRVGDPCVSFDAGAGDTTMELVLKNSPFTYDSDCGWTYLVTAESEHAGTYYVDVRPGAVGTPVVAWLWIYQESNGVDGLQRADEHCSVSGEGDTILF